MKTLIIAALAFPFMLPDFALADTPPIASEYSYELGNREVTEWTPHGDPSKLCIAIYTVGSASVALDCVDKGPSQAPVPVPAAEDCVRDIISIAPSHQFYYGRPFSVFDNNGDDRISLSEFLGVKLETEGKRSPQPGLILSEEEAMSVFLEDDKNADGFIERADWYEARTC